MQNPPVADPFLLGLYGCCTGSEHWTSILDKFCDEVGALSAVLQCVEIVGDRASPYWGAQDSRFDEDAYQTFVSHDQNPRFEAKRLLGDATKGGRVISDDDIFRPEESLLRRHLQVQLKKAGLGHFVGSLIPLGLNRYFTIALHQSPNKSLGYSSVGLERVQAMIPHFVQAATISQSMSMSRMVSALVNQHLDSSPSVMLLCDVRGLVTWMNRRARTQLSSKCELHVHNGLLKTLSSNAQQRLSRALTSAMASGSTEYMTIDTSAGQLQLALQRLDEADESGNHLVLASIVDTAHLSGTFSTDALKALFNLTDTEAILTNALVAGATIEEYAQRRGVTVGTARYQLNQVMNKAGTHRQADLVRRVLCSAAAHLRKF